MKGLLSSCAMILGSVLFSSLLWVPLIELFAHAWADIEAVKNWFLLAGLTATGLITVYMGWPLYESNADQVE